ncbi:transporter substrate-binding domain-containing protein [Rhizobium leguminosarum]|uniref:transporter substrate-binding domain-containing protein n=1 Tax=Rhizobium leguminosarum TaxID=384 RepID=UPI0010303CC8|nr:transporter substrate-binding domain-containing protein [Rhizobium leguminosarum]TBF87920.1 transporter substrate-binding domain-containing protein [Rhizobium leguminosarum]TBG07099.1 transporter substrate-binding domain-containing protein [Rhizobium leguminosarum]TBG07572.1 transporter substrate-binding domain-containing protein [Rhizobium leguminosarum]TBG30783.1 transporter substrate-binding domain-containing protein [Rhizobium leguminosarum]TBG50024.1 transporter substrate-binding domai
MKRHLIFGLAALLVAASLAHGQERTAITIASEGASPPWDFIDGTGALVGFDIDVGNELCARVKMQCTFVAQDWDGIIPGLLVKKYDAIIAGMSITEKRKKSIAFSKPYAVAPNQIVMRRNIGLPASDTTAKLNLTDMDTAKKEVIAKLRESLTGKTLGVLRSSNSEAVVQELFGDVAEVRSYDSQENLKLDLTSERIDGGLGDYLVWKQFLATPEGKAVDFFGPQLSGGTWGPGVGIGLRKEDTALIGAFDKAIEASVKDGTLGKISLKWFGQDISPQLAK